MANEQDLLVTEKKERQTMEIDIRKILEQLGIAEDRWPEEWARPAGKESV